MEQKLLTAAWRLRPERRHLLSDSIAGLTFAVVNVPQAMAHALLATVNPIIGIYTLMVAVPIGAIFTSSVYMNVSSTAALWWPPSPEPCSNARAAGGRGRVVMGSRY